MASVIAALALFATTAGAFSKKERRVPGSGTGDDWAWEDMVPPEEVEDMTPSSPEETSFLLADRSMKPPANASANRSSHSQAAKESISEEKANSTKPEPQVVTSKETVSTGWFGKQLPSAQEIRADNKEKGCVTVDSPLAKPAFPLRIAQVGTPCVFRADSRDEALHCMGVESGTYGEYGWCWTNMQRTER